ncbi:MAG TPA: hypothetical protein GXX72_00765 [Clostridiaceae bacterium]|nr:hypothetical protein [Clostridiaceae bacterium]
MNNKLFKYLFQTNALKIADPRRPFWYTSGKLGPFFINTHFLFGSAVEANTLLAKIELLSREPEIMPTEITALCLRQYDQDKVYRDVIDMACETFSELASEVDFISGGERRDFFFSLLLADIMQKPHLSCFKDGRIYYSEPGSLAIEIVDREQSPLEGQSGLHIADIVTVASSFFRSWIPQVQAAAANLKYAAAILDRGQGGDKRLAEVGIMLSTLGTTDACFFARAVESNLISQEQADVCLAFLRDPDQYMANFLNSNPDFIAEELAKGGKNKERAQLALDMGYAK